MSNDAQGSRRRGTAGPGSVAIAAEISRLIVATSSDGLVAVDDQGTIRLCNQAAEELLARPASELIGTPFGFPVVAGRGTEVELILPGGGERVVEMRVITTLLEDERLHITALRDVTGRRHAERELEAALEDRNIVVAITAHELHSPLAAISVLAHVLRDQRAELTPTEQDQSIERIIELTAHLQLLVRELLTTARIDAVGARAVPERVPLRQLIIGQLGNIEAMHGQVQVSCSPGLAAVADRAEVSMMLANYLENARAYAEPPIEVRAVRRTYWAEIRVIDHGPGVPAAFAPHLFERFTRAPAQLKAEGTGLGLWIVRTFARANGGDAWYEPGKSGGSCFCIRLPLAADPPGSMDQ